MQQLSLSPEAYKVINFYKTLSKIFFWLLYGLLPFLGAMTIVFYISFRQVDASGWGVQETWQLISSQQTKTYMKVTRGNYEGILGNLIGESLPVGDGINGEFIAWFLGKDASKENSYIGANVLVKHHWMVLPRRFYLRARDDIQYSWIDKFNFYLDILELASINNIDAKQLGYPQDFKNPKWINIKGTLREKFRLDCLDAPGVVMPFCKKSFESFLSVLPKINLTLSQAKELESLIKKWVSRFGDKVEEQFCQKLYQNLKFTADPFNVIFPELYYECDNPSRFDKLKEFTFVDKMFFNNDILNLWNLSLSTYEDLRTWTLLSLYQLLKDNWFSKDSLQNYSDFLYKNQNNLSFEDAQLIYFFNARLVKPVLKNKWFNELYAKIDTYDLNLKNKFKIGLLLSGEDLWKNFNNLISAQTIINYIFSSYQGEFALTSKSKIRDNLDTKSSLWEVQWILNIEFKGEQKASYSLPLYMKIEVYSPWSYLIKDVKIDWYNEISKILHTYVTNNEVNSFSLILSRIKDYFRVYQERKSKEDIFCVQAQNVLQRESQKASIISCEWGKMVIRIVPIDKTLKIIYRGYQILDMQIDDPVIQARLKESLKNKILIVSSLPVILESILASPTTHEPVGDVEDLLTIEKLFKIYFKTKPVVEKKLGDKKYSVNFNIKTFKFRAFVDLNKKKIYRLFVEVKDSGSQKTVYKILILPTDKSLCFSYTCKETINLLISSPEKFLKRMGPSIWEKYFQE